MDGSEGIRRMQESRLSIERTNTGIKNNSLREQHGTVPALEDANRHIQTENIPGFIYVGVLVRGMIRSHPVSDILGRG